MHRAENVNAPSLGGFVIGGAAGLVGFAVLGLAFWKTRSIIIPTLLSALAYGVAWKITAFLYV